MLQALAIINGVRFNKKLTNEIRLRNLTINVVALSTTNFETERVLKDFYPDVILLDTKAKKFYDVDFFDKYGHIVVELSYSKYGDMFSNKILDTIAMMTKDSDFERSRRKIAKELEYIGYEFKYKGTHYLLDTIYELYWQNTNTMTDNLQTGIYPIIAKKYDKTVYNIKSSIGKATDCMYYDCDMDKLVKYFHLSYDTKPTPKQVVFTVINKLSK